MIDIFNATENGSAEEKNVLTVRACIHVNADNSRKKTTENRIHLCADYIKILPEKRCGGGIAAKNVIVEESKDESCTRCTVNKQKTHLECVIHELNATILRKHQHVYRPIFFYIFLFWLFCFGNFFTCSYWMRSERHRLLLSHTQNVYCYIVWCGVVWTVVYRKTIKVKKQNDRKRNAREEKTKQWITKNFIQSKTIIAKITRILLSMFGSCFCCYCDGFANTHATYTEKPVSAQAKAISVFILHKSIFDFCTRHQSVRLFMHFAWSDVYHFQLERFA